MNHRLAPILQRYFTSYVLTQRALSPATIRTYRDCWALLLTFVAERTQLPPHALELPHIDHRCVTEFLDYLENERGNSIATRNLRLAAIKAVLTFHCATMPEHLDTIAAVQAIPVKKHPRPHLSYLTATQVQALLDAIDTTTWTGRRDQAMFTLAAHTGLRVSELISLNVDSVHLGAAAHVACTGKGRKHRTTPLTTATAMLLKTYLRERHTRPGHALLPNPRGEPLSADALEAIQAVSQSGPQGSTNPVVRVGACPWLLVTAEVRRAAVERLSEGAVPTPTPRRARRCGSVRTLIWVG